MTTMTRPSIDTDTRARWRVALLGLTGESLSTMTAAVTDAGGQVTVEAPARLDSLSLVADPASDVIVLQPEPHGGPAPRPPPLRGVRAPTRPLHAQHEPHALEGRGAVGRRRLSRRATTARAARAHPRPGGRAVQRPRGPPAKACGSKGDRAGQGPADDGRAPLRGRRVPLAPHPRDANSIHPRRRGAHRARSAGWTRRRPRGPRPVGCAPRHRRSTATRTRAVTSRAGGLRRRRRPWPRTGAAGSARELVLGPAEAPERMREDLVHEPHVERRVADQQPEEEGPVQQIERHLDVQSASDLYRRGSLVPAVPDPPSAERGRSDCGRPSTARSPCPTRQSWW